MAFTTFTLSGDVADLIGDDFDPEHVEIELKASDPIITDGVTETRFGKVELAPEADGTFSITGIPSSALGSPLYALTITHGDPRTRNARPKVTVAWFEMLADDTLAAVVDRTVQPVAISPTVAANIAAAADGATNDTVMAAVASDPESAFHQVQSATYEARAGGVVAAAANGVAAANTAAANTTALNNLHTSALALGATVVLPAGTIPVTTLNLKAPMVGAGKGKTVLSASGTLTLADSKVRLADLSVLSATATAISAANRTDFTMERVSVDWTGAVATAWLGLDAYNIDRLRVVGCSFRIGGLQLSLCDDFLVDGNYWDCEYLNTNEPCHISGQSSGQFVNNTIYRTLTDAVDLYSSGEYCVISGNRLIGLRGASGIECKVTMSDDPGNTSGPGNVLDGVVIANNILRDFNPPAGNATRAGIFAEYVDSRGVPAFSVAETNRAIIITGNVLEDFHVTDPGAGNVVNYWGITYTGHNGLITNNVIRHMRAWRGAVPVGIRVSEPAASRSVGVRVAGNVIAGVEGNTGIMVGNLDRCQIDDNIIRGDEPTATETKFGVNVVAGATLNHCSISNNTLSCNNATGMGVVTQNTSTLNRCRVEGNTFYNCGASIKVAHYCTFVGNNMDNATNSQAFSVGLAGTSCRGNTYTANHFTMSADYALLLIDHNGFVLVGNTFNNTVRAVLLIGTTRDGIVDSNVSIVQTGGTEFPHYSGPLPDLATVQASMSVGSNKVLAS